MYIYLCVFWNIKYSILNTKKYEYLYQYGICIQILYTIIITKNTIKWYVPIPITKYSCVQNTSISLHLYQNTHTIVVYKYLSIYRFVQILYTKHICIQITNIPIYTHNLRYKKKQPKKGKTKQNQILKQKPKYIK